MEEKQNLFNRMDRIYRINLRSFSLV